MIAYVRDGFQITRNLANSLATTKSQEGLGQPSPLCRILESLDNHCQGLYLTTHQRAFPRPDGNPATSIDLYHSWHVC